ncbi:MAG TPA: flavodoxin family protein [Candidatus Copromorpha excrementigallinarum]|uniref:Flavodoxin family protein n=1 Tax=Candidatus Allocopromorpha excrementigallinarum TaxID=2840742 RepID=A0A9D1HYW3_9FIRM|nr:flavodoxin family protein [Candidatus Copromorpha excrementigallinarum]
MKITVLTGSPHKKGTTALLTEKFIEGAEKNGHEIKKIDTAFLEVKPCLACDYCIAHEGRCVQKDDMDKVREGVMKADMVVLSTPVYYFGMSAQIKAAIDRFYAFNDDLLKMKKKSVLISACGDEEEWVPEAIEKHYETICRYLNWTPEGVLVARGVYTREDIEKTDYPAQAQKLGEKVRD